MLVDGIIHTAAFGFSINLDFILEVHDGPIHHPWELISVRGYRLVADIEINSK